MWFFKWNVFECCEYVYLILKVICSNKKYFYMYKKD